MERPETESFTHLPPEVDTSQYIGQASVNPPGYQNLYGLNQDQRDHRPTNADWELRQLHLAFQDSHLSPVLPLLPSTSGVQQNITEYSLFHQSDLEFAPLRASPDISVTSERFHFLPQGHTSQASEHGSLSQHPLAQATVLTDDAASSCCSLSQHSMSPGDEGRKGEMVHSPVTEDHLQEIHFSIDGTENNDGDGHGHALGNLSVKPMEEAPEEDTSFLRGDIPARQLLELLQKDVGMPSGSSSAVSSASETSLKRMGSFDGESKGVFNPDADQSKGRRDSPTGTATLTQQQQTLQLKLKSQSGKSYPRLSNVSNITMGSRNTQPDDTSEALHREMLSEIERRNSSETGFKVQPLSAPTPNLESVTGKPNMARVILAGMCGTGPQFSGGYSVEHGLRQRGLLSLENQTGNGCSFLGFLPQSQSTPGVFHGPGKSRVKAPSDRLSAVESNMRASYESSSRVSQQSVAMPDIVSLDPVTSRHGAEKSCQEETGSGKVQGLPSLNYMQKVDAWRANQSSGKISLFDNLALQGFSGTSPKKNAYNSISDSLNHILLNQQEKTTQHKLPVSSTTNPSVTQSSALTLNAPPSSSSPRRGEAVGSAPNEMDNTGSGAGLSASSLSTVVTSIEKAQHKERLTKGEMSQIQERRLQQTSAVVQPSPLLSLGRFSDVSLDREVSSTLSNSQHSYHSGQNLGASIGVASSVVSLEVDNYAPYWSSMPSSPLPPHKPRELNIEERIPLYLHNLGIDQSPSTILTPFGPRGPIREPEFSPTDLCTIKGSIGTSPKSTQPSEGGTPHKADFSRYSLLSVDSSMSIPLSIDSLCQPIHFLEQARASPQSDVAGDYAAVPISQPQHAPAPQPDQQQQRDDSVSSSQNTIQLGEQFVSESSLVTGCRESESHSQPSIIEKSNRDSFVGDKTLREIRKLLGQAGDVVSGGSSKASTPSSSSSATSHLHSDDDILLSLRKRTGGFMDSSLISSASGTEGPETRSSFLWTRSSSDSMLMSERPRESSIGRESMSSSGQPNYPSTLAPSSPPAVEAYIRPQDSTADSGAGLYLQLSKSVRRAEPEGCSAAPPDSTGPAQLPIVPQPPAVSQPQPALSPRETIGSFSEQEEEGNSQDGLYSQCVPTESVSSSSPPIPGEEQEAMSNASSSESSLAARVAKLLHNESPATLVSSRSSTTDQEESRAREWIKLKITGQQSDPLELDIEDRRRIEEIKREQHPIQSQGSTDTESSAVSSMGDQGGQPPPQPAETTLKTAEDHLSRQLQRLGANPFDSSVQLHTPLGLDLESRVQEIAAREGLTLPRASPAPPALTSITISTCRRSTSPSPSPSPAPPLSPAPPEPLCLTQLSTANKQLPHVVEEDNATPSIQATHTDPVSIQPVLGSEPTSSLYAREQRLSDSELIQRTHGRQDAIGGRNVKSLQGQPREEEVKVRDSYTEAQLQRDLPDANRTAQPEDQGTDQLSMMSDQLNSGSDMGLMTEQATGSSTVDAPTRTGHVSHIHLTLSPKAQEQRQDSGIQPRHAAAGPDLQSSKFYPLRYSSSPATRSGDEGLGLSSPLESYESRDVIRARVPERADTATLFKTMVHEGTETSTYPQSYITPQRLAASTRPLAIPTPAVPVLLPYKPHGSEELFYVPQTEAQASPSRSDTTMESSHPGSDDAVPPYFSSEVLGKQDPGIDRGVSIRHVEGIYSKRLKTATFKMQPTGHSGGTVSVDGSSQTSMSQVTQPSSQVSEAFTRVPLSSNQVPSGSRRDRGTSPVQLLSYGQSERHSVEFQPINVEMDSNTASQRPSAYLASDTVAAMEREQGRCRPDLPQPASRPSGSNLDQLWRKFNERWGSEERRPTSEREASLLDRLERLSRLIHSTAGVRTSLQPEDTMQPRPHNNEDEPRKRGEDAAVKRRERKENVGPLERKSVSGEGGQRRGKPTAPRQAWTQEAEQQTPLAEDNVHSSFSPSRHRCPAERDESDTTSTLSGSMSTVDTARLIRAFGPDRVRCLKSASSLGKLYSTIDKQKEAKEPRRTREMDRDVTPPTIITPSETTVTDDSIVASDSASSTSTYTLPTRRGPSQSLAAKKSVKQVNKGIQAGDLEIVSNGTRRHTRDVGTTFPSPGEARGPRQLPSSSSSSSLERGRGDERSPSKTQVFLKERKSKRSHGKHYPQGVTWFVPAEHLRSEARKENQPEEDEQWVQRPSSAWFQPYSRTSLWREPLRERQIQEEWNSYKTRPDPDPRDKTTSSGLVRVSLQEALELHRPTFIALSRERMKRLALQAEERKLQVLFSREREQFYTRPGGPERLPRPAGIPLIRRAVPRKEMVQRSKQIYENLPEVQRRRDEQRRKAEYQSYRLNAQLFNKKVTNRVHGRQVPWH